MVERPLYFDVLINKIADKKHWNYYDKRKQENLSHDTNIMCRWNTQMLTFRRKTELEKIYTAVSSSMYMTNDW